MPKDEFAINSENTFNSNDDTYIETLIIKDKMVNVFQSSSGQCYWFQWLEDGKLKSMSCGTYNIEYKQEIESFFESELERCHRMIIDLRDDIRELQREISKIKEK